MSRRFKPRKKPRRFRPKATRKEAEEAIKDAGYSIIETPNGGEFHIHPEHQKP